MGDMKPLVYADAYEKRQAWRAVFQRQDLKGSDHTKFKDLTRLDLSDAEIWTLAMRDIENVRNELRDSERFPKMATYPRSAQLGLYDMGYNLGVPNLIKVFEKFTPAVQWRNWKVAAAESHRLQPNEERNRAVQEMFEKALKQEPFFVHPTCKKGLKTLHGRGR